LYSQTWGDAGLTLLRVIAKLSSRFILGRAKALLHVPQFVARTRAVGSSTCHRTLVGRRRASGGQPRRHAKLACSLRRRRRGIAKLHWVMDTACGRRRGGDSDHRHHFWTPIRFVVGSFCSRGLVAGPVGSRSLVLRCALVWPQTHHVIATARVADLGLVTARSQADFLVG
jgi:hypothetical protein